MLVAENKTTKNDSFQTRSQHIGEQEYNSSSCVFIQRDAFLIGFSNIRFSFLLRLLAGPSPSLSLGSLHVP
jgi:hypothetical protein